MADIYILFNLYTISICNNAKKVLGAEKRQPFGLFLFFTPTSAKGVPLSADSGGCAGALRPAPDVPPCRRHKLR